MYFLKVLYRATCTNGGELSGVHPSGSQIPANSGHIQ
jgi:hypothetical protein